MALTTIHNSFSRGELDPTMLARTDLDSYRFGARRMRNCIGLWTGACQLAAGQQYVDVMVDRTNANAPITDATLINSVDFQYSYNNVNALYTIVIRPDTTDTVAIDIYYLDVLQVSVGANMYTTAQIKELGFAAAQNRILILQNQVPTRQLVRGNAHNAWTLSAYTPSIFPVFDYTTLGGTQYRVAGFTFTPGAATGNTTLTASSAIFTANHVGGVFVGGQGIARITAVASATSASITVIDDFAGTAAIPGDLSSLSEVMWTSGGGSPAGANRGWPSKGAFFLNRLILGNSYSLPNIAALSVASVYDNFDDSATDALAGFSASLNGAGDQSIKSIVVDDSLIFVTAGKIFAQNPLIDTPLTVSNFYFAPQSQDPSGDIPAATIDNQVLHVNGSYSQVMRVVYSTADAKYKAIPVGLLSNHLFETINSNATYEPKNIQARLYYATQENGTMLMYNTLADENISCWTLRTTRGQFKRVIGIGPAAHAIVKRDISIGASYLNTLDKVFITTPEFNAFVDVTSQFADAGVDVGFMQEFHDYLLIGNNIPFTRIQVALNTVASADLELTFEYLDANGDWNFFTPTDGTNGFSGAGNITWTFSDVVAWAPNLAGNVQDSFFWIRIRRTLETVTTTPIEDKFSINTASRLYLENITFDEHMDCVITTSSNSSGAVTGLTALAGQQVYSIANGATRGPFFVNSDGTTNIGNEYASVKIGLQYVPELIPMPLYTPTVMGDNTYGEKYVKGLYVDYYNSLYIRAGAVGSALTDIGAIPLNAYTLGTAIQGVSGVQPLTPRGDWEARQEFIVTQSQPGPFTIRGVGYMTEVE